MKCLIVLCFKYPESDWRTRGALPYRESDWQADKGKIAQLSEKRRCHDNPAESLLCWARPWQQGGKWEAFVTYGTPISKILFWISCFPNMMMLSWMQSSMRQPPGAHCREKKTMERVVRPSELRGARAWIQTWCNGDKDEAGSGGCSYKPLARQETPVASHTYLFHAVTIEHINIASRSAHKPEIDKCGKS